MKNHVSQKSLYYFTNDRDKSNSAKMFIDEFCIYPPIKLQNNHNTNSFSVSTNLINRLKNSK